MEIKNDSKNVIQQTNLANQDFKVVGNKVKSYTAIELNDATVDMIKLTGDRQINDGEGYNGIGVIGGNTSIANSEITNFGGYGIVTTNGVNKLTIYTGIKDEDGKGILGVSYKNLEGVDANHIHLIKRINVEKIPQFELGYTMGYAGYPYCNGRNYVARFFNEENQVISEIATKQYDKVVVPQGAKLVDFIIEQSYIPTTGNTDFDGTVLFLSDYAFPVVKILNNNIHHNTRENIAICGGQGIYVSGNSIHDTWIGLCIEDGWELCKDIIIEENEFNNNGRDVIVASGRNLIFKNNVFRNWVNIGNRVEGLQFIGNTFDISLANHEATNDRFVVEFHNTKGEIAYNVYKNARVAFSSTQVKSEIKIHHEHYINTHINAMPSYFLVEDSIVEMRQGIRMSGQFFNTEVFGETGSNSYLVGVTLDKCYLHDISRVQLQKINMIKGSKFVNVGIELGMYPDSSLVVDNTEFINCKLSLGGEKETVIKGCTFTLSNPLIDLWNCSGKANIKYIDCRFIATKEIDYLAKAVYAGALKEEYQITFEGCSFDNKIKAIANDRMQKYIVVK